MTTRAAIRSLCAAAALLMLAAPSAHAQREDTTRVLLDGELRGQVIRLVSLSEEAITYEDERGRRRQATIGGLVALLPIPPSYGSPTEPTPSMRPNTSQVDSGFLETVDGQRFPGAHAPTGGEEEQIVWSHPAFGRVAVPLENVARVVMRAGVGQRVLDQVRANGEAPLDDQLFLINGDRLAGFLETLADPTVIDTEEGEVAVPVDRVAAARLANPVEALAGLVVWLEDGTVALVASVDQLDSGALEITLPSGQRAKYPLGALRAVAFEAGKLLPLADLEPVDQQPIGRRALLNGLTLLDSAALADIDPLNAPDIMLPGAMSVTFELPEGARRFATIAELPVDAQPWGDFELLITVDGEERFRRRLHADAPREEIAIPLTPTRAGSRLTITIEPANYGPINDRALLRRPLLLIDPR